VINWKFWSKKQAKSSGRKPGSFNPEITPRICPECHGFGVTVFEDRRPNGDLFASSYGDRCQSCGLVASALTQSCIVMHFYPVFHLGHPQRMVQ